MASGGKRGGSGERVLESRHVIGLFMLMLLFSGVFFTLGYVMGRNEYDGQVRAASDLRGKLANAIWPKTEPASRKANNPTPTDTPTDTTAPPNSDWEFYHAGEKKTADHLKPVASTPAVAPAPKKPAALVRTAGQPKSSSAPAKSLNVPLIPGGTYTLQVAATTREADALELATRLQKKKFPAFVLSPRTDKYYRVQVGPYIDPKAAEAARKGLEGAGFKAIVKH
jgi:septal ring-binding cell division protein DamX